MTPTLDTSTASDRAPALRAGMVETLRQQGAITAPAVERAFQTVPRHRFVPDGTPLEVAYNADDAVPIKHAADGVVISSISAPFVQARMIEQAQLRPGHRVLEIGSGGYNAALIAEVVGPTGHVTSVDIDSDITGQALRLLDATGYGKRITVVQADADTLLPGLKPVDAIVVTAGAWDLPPAWLDQLAHGGVLVVPLVMNGVTRSIAFHHTADHLVSASAQVCGFVPIQGQGAHDGRSFVLPHPGGGSVRLRFDIMPAASTSLLDGVLATGEEHIWSGVMIRHQVSFADLHLWLACFLPGFCRMAADDTTDLSPADGHWFPFGAVSGDSIGSLIVRPALDGTGVEFGATGFGPHAHAAASAVVEQIQAWDRRSRRGPDDEGRPPVFEYWPTGAQPRASTDDTAVLAKTHGQVTISWPAVSAD